MRKYLSILIALGWIAFAVVAPAAASQAPRTFEKPLADQFAMARALDVQSMGLSLDAQASSLRLQRYAQMGMSGVGEGGFGSSGACPQASTVLARYASTGGTLSGTEQTQMTTLMCGLVTAGLITGNMNGAGPTGSGACGTGAGTFDAIWVMGVNNKTNAYMNICSTSFPAADFNTPGFTANQGILSISSSSSAMYCPTCTLSTFGGNLVQNSASLMVCILTNQTSVVNVFDIGASATNSMYLGASLDRTVGLALNDNTFNQSSASAGSQGFWLATRTGASARAVYGPSGSSTPIFSDTQASTGVPTTYIMVGARSSSGAWNNGSDRQYAIAAIGSGFTGAQYATMATLFNNYVKGVNGGSGCF